MMFVSLGARSVCAFCSSPSVPLKDRRLLEVKLGELPSWILMRDFTPSGIAGAFQRGQRLLGVGEYKRVSGLHVSFCPE